MALTLSNVQAYLSNSAFLVSFFTTLYYWIKMIFFSTYQYKPYGFIGFTIINSLLILQLLERWFESGHFPLSSLYESLLFLTWGLTIVYLGIERFIKSEFIGTILSPLVLCILTFGEFTLPSELQETKPLVPALQSNWLFMHVSVMMISYAALLIGSVLAISSLVIHYSTNSPNPSQALNSPDRGSFQDSTTLLLNLFDNLSYRTIGIGFCLLTLGILSGAVWANETWGTYWSWDPKETWAFITWIIFAIFLHTRLVQGWTKIRSAWIASSGFVTIWICYLGVNLLGKGLHSYGFFQ